MQKRLFLHLGTASLGGTLAGCLATPGAGKVSGAGGAAPAGAPASNTAAGSPDAAPDWETLRTPATGIPSVQAQQAARQAFERAAGGQLTLPPSPAGTPGAFELSASDLRGVAAAQDSMDRALADFARRWPSISPGQRQAAMARTVTPTIAQTMGQMVRLADQQRSRPPQRSTTSPRQSAPDVVVQPGSSASFDIKGYCLDARVPAPVKNDLAYISPVGDRIPASLMPLYEGAAAWVEQSPRNAALGQQVYWALAHAGSNSPWARTPSPRIRQAFDEMASNGASTFDAYHQSELAKREVLKQVLRQTGLDRYVGAEQIARGDYAGAAQRALDQQIAQGSRMPSQRGLGYSWLAPGVAARATGSAPLGMAVEVLNTSAQPYRFIPASFIAQPADKKQPVALPGRLNGISTANYVGGSPWSALEQMFTGLGDKLRSFFSRPIFGGSFDWMFEPPRFDMTMGRAWASLQDLDRRYPLKAAIGAMPVIGNSLSLYEGVTGQDWLYNQQLTDTEQVIALVSTIPGEATLLQGLKVLESSGALRALERVPGLEQFARNLPLKVEEAIDTAVFQAAWVPLRGALRNARGENNANALPDSSRALLDENLNVFQMLSSPSPRGLGLPAPVRDVFRQQSPNWASLMGLK